ncbi:MAG TPA: cytochrome c maturation protein CcmE [Solirubrobacteraceae bacterium]|jgi:cytochrome c-type biogenesis protein CcmE|nr:cytochrome c maturation protein CcmE [Solirubrobacteraceae bacterium]
MNPERKRTVRLVVALTAAVLLATALIYTSFSAADPAVTPTQLVREVRPGHTYVLTGTVVAGSVRRVGPELLFRVEDRTGSALKLPVTYTGTVPDPFEAGREIVVNVNPPANGSGIYVAQSNSLITKCPSKYQAAPPSSS